MVSWWSGRSGYVPDCGDSQALAGGFARFGRGIFTAIRMTDGRFYLLLALLLLALAGGEIVYAMVGPLSEPPRQLDELTSINRVR